MAPTPRIRIVKSTPARGGTQVWSNTYHFAGGTPADDAHWHTLMDNVVAAEKLVLATWTTIIEAVGYVAGSNIGVASKTYTTAGTNGGGTGHAMPIDVAALIRYATAARSTKNHPVFLFNYYHGVYSAAGDQDSLESGTVTKMGTYADAWLAGFSDGAVTYTRAGPRGAAATARLVEPLLTHRDFPR